MSAKGKMKKGKNDAEYGGYDFGRAVDVMIKVVLEEGLANADFDLSPPNNGVGDWLISVWLWGDVYQPSVHCSLKKIIEAAMKDDASEEKDFASLAEFFERQAKRIRAKLAK